MKRRIAVGLIGGGLLTSALSRQARGAGPLRLAAPALDSTALIFFANEMGFFKNNGLDVEVQAMPNGESVTVALAGGAIDIGCSECVSLILAFHRGIPITIVAPGGMQTPRSPVGMFFVQQNSTATGGRDMNGKTVAVVGLNGFAQYGTQNWLDKTGGTSSTVKFIQLAGAQIGVALQDGRVDGAFVPEPFVSQVRKVARPVANPMAAVAPTYLSSAHFASLPWAKANADTVRRFQATIRQTADWANKNHDQSALILEKVARVSPEIVQASTRSFYGDRLEASMLQPLIDVAAKYGGFTSFSASDMVFRA
ncbi:MAG TPA: ABC transporter substrate-binding protein [Candidatus Acidoferrales bacterium]|nr:ABC transporter substrate-binding protein [Candidatus Acidoferrales bacterium]